MKESIEQELKKSQRKSAKPMLWISMISMTMMFAGLTSAYVVSRSRADWVSFNLPNAFNISTTLIVLSSFTFLMAKRFIKKENQQLTTLFLIATLLLGLGFVYFQFDGFSQLYQEGLYFAGDQSTVKSSFIYGIAIAHLVHIFAGLIVLIVVLFNQLSKKYSASNYLGLELGAIFWHFVDILWVYLFFFFYFIR
ncbi:MAG: cytochrome c oxidase subunit 3 [Lutibacter sp.]|jgi:cytochrome c oxidase subunit 3|uniref:cytochrome c oxidase subunit 3 n=1 Tax=Lutibacter sp. TaxID=1925666 RepID=UPI00299E4A7E|nr:cytochrome c oxidase subunit 3 [Lutibacter sp.]MDX1828557.1 cytochrome c oxidase subunit 3 [Lutibacter sp.]